MYYETKLAF